VNWLTRRDWYRGAGSDGLQVRDVHSMGDIAANVMNPKAGMLESVNDPRYPVGEAAGY
jgi:hypothetical protein